MRPVCGEAGEIDGNIDSELSGKRRYLYVGTVAHVEEGIEGPAPQRLRIGSAEVRTESESRDLERRSIVKIEQVSCQPRDRVGTKVGRVIAYPDPVAARPLRNFAERVVRRTFLAHPDASGPMLKGGIINERRDRQQRRRQRQIAVDCSLLIRSTSACQIVPSQTLILTSVRLRSIKIEFGLRASARSKLPMAASGSIN